MNPVKFIKHTIKSKLERSSIYLKIRYSNLFLKCWLSLNKKVRINLKKQESFYQQLLEGIRVKDAIIFDIGANEGFITAVFLKRAKLVVAVEPAPMNVNILKSRFYNRPSILIIPKAVSNRVGVDRLFLEKGTALHTLEQRWKNILEAGQYHIKTEFKQDIKVEKTTLTQLINEFGIPAFIKVDTEGHEEKVFSTLQLPVPQMLFEAVLPVFFQETITILKHLETIDSKSVFNYSINNQLMLNEFVSFEEMMAVLKNITVSIDIICRMSNYEEYYDS